MPLYVSTKGTTASAFPLYRKIQYLLAVLEKLSKYWQDSIEPFGSILQMISSAHGPFQTEPLAWQSTAWRVKQLQTPSKKPQGGPSTFNCGCPLFLANSFLILVRILSCESRYFTYSAELEQQYPQISQGLTPSKSRLNLGRNLAMHQSDLRFSLHAFSQNGTISGSTISFLMINSIVLLSSVSKLITPLPTNIPTKLIRLAVGCCKLYLSIKTDKSGIYFPAQDSPAIKNLLFLYSGYLLKKLRRAFKESLAVIASLYLKDEFELKEYPTPAGDSKKRRFDALCQEFSLQVNWSPILQSTPSSRQQGPIQSKNPEYVGPYLEGKSSLDHHQAKAQQDLHCWLPLWIKQKHNGVHDQEYLCLSIQSRHWC